MIIKSFETNKINFNNSNLLLLYGKNEGLKNYVTKDIIKDKNNVFSYDEKEILDNLNFFFETVLSKSLFEKEKIIIIKRATDKIIKIIEEIYSKNLKEIFIIINADTLEKKSKLRSFFEKDKKCICVAFYPDTDETLSKLTYNYLKEKKITISQADINLITSKCNGDRETLINELKKRITSNDFAYTEMEKSKPNSKAIPYTLLLLLFKYGLFIKIRNSKRNDGKRRNIPFPNSTLKK